MNTETEFEISDWKSKVKSSRSPSWKVPVFSAIRPFLSLAMRTQLSPESLNGFKPSLVLPDKGFPQQTRRKWATAGKSIEGKTVLVQGTGSGWDVVSWAEMKPARIIAVDLYEFPSWNEISEYCSDTFNVKVDFRKSSLESMSFIPDHSIDLCASDAVFEHCKDLLPVLKETHRVLKPSGYVYAIYGPLWYCAGGDHFSGRGGEENLYNHVSLSKDLYRSYFDQHRLPVEDFQNGGRYVELDLFSKLTTGQYLQIYKEAGFAVDDLILELSLAALKYKYI